MTDILWQRANEWVGTPVEESFVMIHLDTGTYLTLNRTARAVWDFLETPQSQSAIEDRLLARFDIDPEICSSAVTDLLAEMRAQKLASPV